MTVVLFFSSRSDCETLNHFGALWKFWPITKSRTYFKTRRNQSICIWWLPKYLRCHFWTVWARSFVESSLHPPFPDASNERYTDILSPFNLASHSPHCEHFEFVDHFRELYYFQLAVCGARKVNLETGKRNRRCFYNYEKHLSWKFQPIPVICSHDTRDTNLATLWYYPW